MFFGDFFVLHTQIECEHVENMSPFLTCFPRLLSAKPFGWGHTHRAHIRRRRLIMSLVALVQKKQSAPATAYKYWCLGFASSSPLLLAFRLRTSECLLLICSHSLVANRGCLCLTGEFVQLREAVNKSRQTKSTDFGH